MSELADTLVLPPEFYWAVGLFEGEGCITEANIRGQRIVLRINMTNRDVVERFCAAVGVGFVRKDGSCHKRNPLHKMQWRWEISGDASATLLRRMLPLLGERRTARATELLERRDEYIAHLMRARDCVGCGKRFRPTSRHSGASQTHCDGTCYRRWQYATKQRKGVVSV